MLPKIRNSIPNFFFDIRRPLFRCTCAFNETKMQRVSIQAQRAPRFKPGTCQSVIECSTTEPHPHIDISLSKYEKRNILFEKKKDEPEKINLKKSYSKPENDFVFKKNLQKELT